jgi:tRNA(fMet)-specific endonuclease VapC
MSYLLDTNICSAHIRRPAGLAHRFVQHSGRLYVSTIVLGELYAGAYMSAGSPKILAGIADLLNDTNLLPFDALCAEQFGKLRGILKRQGIGISPIDLQIAAVAIVHGLTFVTNNTADFQKVPGMTLEDWLKP